MEIKERVARRLARTRENAAERHMLMDGGRRYIVAYGCARAWATLTFTGFGIGTGAAVIGGAPWSFNPHFTFDITFIMVSLVMAFAFRRFLPLNESRRLRRLSCVAMGVGSAAVVAALWLPDLSYLLMVTGSLVAGVGYGLFLLLAAEVLATFNLLRIFLFLAAAQLLGVGITFFCDGMGALQVSVALLVLPVLAAVYLRGAYTHRPSSERPRRTVPRFSYPWKLFALFALYAFAYGMRANQLAAGAGRHSSASTFILMAVLFLTAYFASKRFNIGLLYRSPVVLMVCGFLLVPAEGLLGSAVSSWLISISYSLMSFLVMFLLFDIAKRMGVAIVAFIAIKNAEQVFEVLGSIATGALGLLELPSATENLTVTVIVSILILAATALLFSEKELAGKWGVGILEQGGLIERSAEEERTISRVEALAERCRLSPREQEVLLLLAQGKTGRQVQQELFIAEGTFKAHTRHIYEKVGVNSRKELFDALGL